MCLPDPTGQQATSPHLTGLLAIHGPVMAATAAVMPITTKLFQIYLGRRSIIPFLNGWQILGVYLPWTVMRKRPLSCLQPQ